MFGLSYNDIVEKILKEKKDISKEELEEKIKIKILQLSDLISKEGAAQIIANQLGVKLGEDLTGKKLKINEIPKGVGSVNALGKILQIYDVREFNKNGRAGKVANLIIGDETATIRIVVWDEKLISEIEGGSLTEGDILRVRNAYSRVNNGRNELHLGNKAQIEINPPGEKIGEIQNNIQIERPKTQLSKVEELKEGVVAEIQGTVVQLFEPRYYLACSQCNKKVTPQGDKYVCSSHGDVEPKKSAIVNFFFDDGTSNIRVVCFSNQAEQLFNKPNDEITNINIGNLEQYKRDILGKQLSIVGRTTRNAIMDRLEFTSMNILELNPVELIKLYGD